MIKLKRGLRFQMNLALVAFYLDIFGFTAQEDRQAIAIYLIKILLVSDRSCNAMVSKSIILWFKCTSWLMRICPMNNGVTRQDVTASLTMKMEPLQ